MQFFYTARRMMRPVGAMVAVFAVAGCSTDLLSVPTPNVISEGAIGSSLGVTALRNARCRTSRSYRFLDALPSSPQPQ